ncbi:uncharacterized protein EV154DRAFT_551257 [Mucor mucedo]|uniref:uncharacterized protein n=1 Tax=Mucor mucedo TaxID=29922 RepID=UPI00221F21DD|nr:uncharacterized protein EV154DRAFT_551257 [Mucor mucedo]KAI7891715.1 hypothetical protein EV154DRAFT_551257 [Mucor mucedo]
MYRKSIAETDMIHPNDHYRIYDAGKGDATPTGEFSSQPQDPTTHILPPVLDTYPVHIKTYHATLKSSPEGPPKILDVSREHRVLDEIISGRQSAMESSIRRVYEARPRDFIWQKYQVDAQ